MYTLSEQKARAEHNRPSFLGGKKHRITSKQPRSQAFFSFQVDISLRFTFLLQDNKTSSKQAPSIPIKTRSISRGTSPLTIVVFSFSFFFW